MIARTGFEKKTTNPPVFLEVNESICISTMIGVSGFVFSRCPRGGGSVFSSWSLPLRVGIWRCKQRGLASKPGRHVLFFFPKFQFVKPSYTV